MCERTHPKRSAEKEFAQGLQATTKTRTKKSATRLNKITISGLQRGQIAIRQPAKCTLQTGKGVHAPHTG